MDGGESPPFSPYGSDDEAGESTTCNGYETWKNNDQQQQQQQHQRHEPSHPKQDDSPAAEQQSHTSDSSLYPSTETADGGFGVPADVQQQQQQKQLSFQHPPPQPLHQYQQVIPQQYQQPQPPFVAAVNHNGDTMIHGMSLGGTNFLNQNPLLQNHFASGTNNDPSNAARMNVNIYFGGDMNNIFHPVGGSTTNYASSTVNDPGVSVPVTSQSERQSPHLSTTTAPSAEETTASAVSLTTTPNSHSESNSAQLKQAPVDALPSNDGVSNDAEDDEDDDEGVIEILSDDENYNNANDNDSGKAISAKRQRLENGTAVAMLPLPVQHQQQYALNGAAAAAGGVGASASYQSRLASVPDWMHHQPPPPQVTGAAVGAMGHHPPYVIRPGQSLNGYNQNYASLQPVAPRQPYYGGTAHRYGDSTSRDRPKHRMEQTDQPGVPVYIDLPSGFVPTWKTMIPDTVVKPKPKIRNKAFRLSLISSSEFTITGLPLYPDGEPTPIAGLRAMIKRISREHGKAVFEAGRWKIPVGAYHAFVAYLNSDPLCVRLEPIPDRKLNIASASRARMEKDYPAPAYLIRRGVPPALAHSLAPFQRGGVDFVLEREGRALIADEMGLGKTIQSIASMAVYHKDWPLLVLTPSGARYHWESEFRNWLGVNGSAASKRIDEFSKFDDSKPDDEEFSAGASGNTDSFELLKDSQIHVLTSSKVGVLPRKDIRVVICSYGLAPMLAANGGIQAGMFPSAIADESHMLKNIKSKRTKCLLPILNACKRCVLLSGTPALAKPWELWPQLQILRTEQRGFWDDENDFMDKYVRDGSSERRAELHTMLTGTVMIRRLKDDILKDMPRKAREKAIVRVESPEMRRSMQECMELLREGKGVLGKLARQHSAVASNIEATNETTKIQDDDRTFHQLLSGNPSAYSSDAKEAAIQQQIVARYQQRQYTLQHTFRTTPHQLGVAEVNNLFQQQLASLQSEILVEYKERLHEVRGGLDGANGEQPTRATVLSQMYSLTGKTKIPAVSDFVRRWLQDPTRGKLCIFAHHIFVLDAIAKEVGLSNDGKEGSYKYMRIDGKTSPKTRQEHIDAFQTDPSIRIALLGITAAGVAVTLTAASHVLFAELFWTPAIMIQAEDRCHRIGQQARVHCMYFVASGTLDDILWKLIEKKFKELGEFVEGETKKLIVHKTYNNADELRSIFDVRDESDDDDDSPDQVGSGSEEPELLPIDNDLQHDIEKLGKEEQDMLLSSDRDDDDAEAEPAVAIREVATVGAEEDGVGRSQDDAIALSDDDEDEEANSKPAAIIKAVELIGDKPVFNTSGVFTRCKVYKMWQVERSLEVEVGLFKNRLVVQRKLPPRIDRFGIDCKPDVGDVLIAVASHPLPQVINLNEHLNFLKKYLEHPDPVLLWFADDPDFKQFFSTVNTAKIREERRRREAEQGPEKVAEDIIELLDD